MSTKTLEGTLPKNSSFKNKDNKKAEQPFGSYQVRVIYCFTSDYHQHEGKVKLGDTSVFIDPSSPKDFRQIATEAAIARIKEYTTTAALNTELLWAEISPDFNIRDHTIHAILQSNGISKTVFDFETGQREWFNTDADTAHAAYEAAIAGISTIGLDYENYKITLRDEQALFVKNTLEAWLRGEEKRLWNAKMRFGKTPTAYSFIEASLTSPRPIRRVLVITHRPVVNISWGEDADKLLKKHGFQYSSKSATNMNFANLDKDKPFIHFVSTQDMRGKGKTANGFKASNAEIFATEWDLIIIDEAHEGNETELAVEVHDNLSRKFTLYLSGTPFKYLSSGQFDATQIDTWDYIDEQEAKANWDDCNGVNPWGGLAKLWINTIEMRDIVKSEYSNDSGEDAAFDFNEMFALFEKTTKFAHEEDICLFFNVITDTILTKAGLNKTNKSFMPFSKERRDLTRHTLWVLPSVAACAALKNLLEKHSFFKDYTIVNVAGNDSSESQKPLEAVRKAIGSNPMETKTITLTVGRLTTGVTVPEWTGILMLRNTNSAEFYMQTIFRAQSPHEFEGMVKTEAFVWDFAPDRVLKVFTDVAGVSVKAGGERDETTIVKLGRLLNYLPIISHINNNDMKVMDAGDVTRELKRSYTRRVVDSGFDSNLMFVTDFSNLGDEIREALQEVFTVSKGALPSTKDKVNNDIVISSNAYSNTDYEILSKEVKQLESVKKELTAEELELLELRKEELKQRSNIRAILKTISVRLPFMLFALMLDEDFKATKLKVDFTLEEFADKFDNESWKEFFGGITKELFITLSPAFDKDILQLAVAGWVSEVEEAFALRETGTPAEYLMRILAILSRIKDPNKETIFTPYGTVEIHYTAAGFGTEEDWKKAILEAENEQPMFYDVNTKSGIYPLFAAANLVETAKDKTWAEVCDESIFANARTLAGKLATCALLGKPRDWDNITVIDVIEVLESEKIQHLSDEAKNLYVAAKLADKMNIAKNESYLSLSDIENERDYISKLENYDKLGKEVMKDKDMSEEEKVEKLEAAKADLKDLSFDHVVSNPPYQINLTETTSKAKPIWQNFVLVSCEIGKHVAIINPARWQKGGQGTGLSGIKTWFMSNPHFEKVINMSAGEIFPTASIAGDISIEIIDNTKTFKNPKIGAWDKANGWSEFKDLVITEDIDIPLSDTDTEIVQKIITAAAGENFEKEIWVGGENNELKRITKNATNRGGGEKRNYTISGQRMINDTDYFITESEKNAGVEYVKVWYNEKKSNTLSSRYVPLDEFVSSIRNKKDIPKWKSMFPKTGASFIYRNLGPIGEPNTLSTNTWLCRSFDTEQETLGFNSYLQTYFYRYLVVLRSVTHNAYANVHRFVPDLVNVINPRTGKIGYESDWTDDDLVVLFKDVLTVEDWKHIKATAVAADNGKGDYEAGWVFPDGSTRHSLTLPEEDN